MSTATYTLISQTTLAAGTASVSFSGFPQTFRDLVVVYNGTNSDSNAGMLIRLNADTGSNYSAVYMHGYNTGTNSTTQQGTTVDIFFGSTERTSGILQLMDYSATDKHKTMLLRSDIGGGVGATRAEAIRWANSAAVTSIVLFRSGANVSAGSTFSLYGIAA